MRKDSVFNKQCWKNWISSCKRMKLEPYLTMYTIFNLKLMKKVKPKT